MAFEDKGYRSDGQRWLDIGPGWDEVTQGRIPGFETLDIEKRSNVDHVADASESMPFDDDTFDLIHASHILEHIPWQLTEATLMEWVRILKPNGWLEIWVPNALKACEAFVKAEEGNYGQFMSSPAWRKKSVKHDPCRMANGYVFAFQGYLYQPWGIHKALFSPRYLKLLLRQTGLKKVTAMKKKDVRAIKDFIPNQKKWINMGFRGQKPILWEKCEVEVVGVQDEEA